MTVGFEVLVHDVMAAIATDPVRMSTLVPPTSTGTVRYASASTGGASATTGSAGGSGSVVAPAVANAVASEAGNDSAEASSTTPSPRMGSSAPRSARFASRPFGKFDRKFSAERLERDAVLRPARTGDRRRDAGQVELEQLVEDRVRRPVRATAPASSRSARRARSARATGRSGGGRRASRRRSGRASRSPRTRGSCC